MQSARAEIASDAPADADRVLTLLDPGLFRHALDGLSDAVAIIDAHWRVLYLNGAGEGLFQRAAADLVGETLETVFAEAEEFQAFSRWFDQADVESSVKEIARYRRADGEVFPGDTTLSVMRNDGGAVLAKIVTIRDIGAQRLADETLHGLYAISSAAELCADEKVERILRLGAAYYGAPNAVMGRVVDGVYRVDYALGPATNRGRTAKLSETVCGELLSSGQSVMLLDAPGAFDTRRHFGLSGAELGCYIAAPVFVSDEEIGSVSFFGPSRNAEHPPNAADFARLFAHWIGYQVSRERVLEDLRVAHEEAQSNFRVAEAASRAKSKFLATMSHELRTPLNAILGFSELIAAKLHGDTSEKYFEYGADIQKSAQKLLGMIDDLLSMSRLETERLTLAEELFDPIDEVQGGLLKMRPEALAAGVELSAAPNLPRMTLRAERKAFRQVLGNLLSNAVKFTDPGGKIFVDLKLGADGAAAVHVLDTGCGIPDDDLQRVFRPFEQKQGDANPMLAGAGGSGLGLTICRELMEAHGGALELESAVGQGTIAKMLWPAERVASAASAPAVRPARREEGVAARAT